MGKRCLFWSRQHCRPNCSLRDGYLLHRRPGGHRGHKESGFGCLPWGGFFSYLQELGLIGRYRWGLRCGRPSGRQVEGLEFVTVPRGGNGHGSGAGDRASPVTRVPRFWARGHTVSEARFPEAGHGGYIAQWRVTHSPRGSRHPEARICSPQAQWVLLSIIRGRASIWKASLRGWGWK